MWEMLFLVIGIPLQEYKLQQWERMLTFLVDLRVMRIKTKSLFQRVNELVMDKFDTNKLYISEPERMKSFKHIDHVNEIIRPKI